MLEWLTDRGTSTCASPKSPPPVNPLAWLGAQHCVETQEWLTDKGMSTCSSCKSPPPVNTLAWLGLAEKFVFTLYSNGWRRARYEISIQKLLTVQPSNGNKFYYGWCVVSLLQAIIWHSHSFFTSKVDVPITHWIVRFLGPRTSLYALERVKSLVPARNLNVIYEQINKDGGWFSKHLSILYKWWTFVDIIILVAVFSSFFLMSYYAVCFYFSSHSLRYICSMLLLLDICVSFGLNARSQRGTCWSS